VDDDDDDTNLADFLSGIVDHAEASPAGVRRWPLLVHAPSRPQPAPAGAPGGADPQRRQFALDRGLPVAASWADIGAFDDAERAWRKAAREDRRAVEAEEATVAAAAALMEAAESEQGGVGSWASEGSPSQEEAGPGPEERGVALGSWRTPVSQPQSGPAPVEAALSAAAAATTVGCPLRSCLTAVNGPFTAVRHDHSPGVP
jgi:hypothetical protein